MNSRMRNRGIGITLAIVVLLSPSGTGRTMVLVVSVFMILQRSGQNHAWESAKSAGVSLMSMGSPELGSASLQKAKVWPLLGCWVPKATPSHLMPWRMITWLSGFMTASRGNGAGCLPKRRISESGMHSPVGENIPSNSYWDSHAPAIRLPIVPEEMAGLGQGSFICRHGKGDVVSCVVMV